MQVLSLLSLLLSCLLGGSITAGSDADRIEREPAAASRVEGDGTQKEGGEERDSEASEMRRVAVLPVRGESLGGKRGARRPGSKEPRRRSEALDTEERARTFTGEEHGTKASQPRPVDGGRNLPRSPVLRWSPGAGAVSHDVWFGSSAANLVFHGNQLETSCPLPELGRRTRYAWRIDEVDAQGRRTPGDVWTFRTSRG